MQKAFERTVARPSRVLSYQQAQERLGCSDATLTRYLKKGWLRRVYVSNRERALGVDESSIERFLAAKEQALQKATQV
jgi:predicted site-specific integrase-resolvase